MQLRPWTEKVPAGQRVHCLAVLSKALPGWQIRGGWAPVWREETMRHDEGWEGEMVSLLHKLTDIALMKCT